ncbi:hypothetical protein QBC34DRAFT_393157 [Podospora aff. communis PSN243]|uniref:Secreted protein n=1 Tax=Podospora aff. communis PSN243 TaxID=3040156 RepID=A0AAV9H479_9PEZI|nr:hypothetical protein QBC34DRAFT_393157 [Podospora aff. communis PSN243]
MFRFIRSCVLFIPLVPGDQNPLSHQWVHGCNCVKHCQTSPNYRRYLDTLGGIEIEHSSIPRPIYRPGPPVIPANNGALQC